MAKQKKTPKPKKPPKPYKCSYKYCTLGGLVDRDKATKFEDKAGYYHEACLKRKMVDSEIMDYYYQNYNQNEPIAAYRKAMSNYLAKYESGYILYCLKVIKPNINSIFGLTYTLSHKQNERDYLKYRASKMKFNFGNVEEYNGQYEQSLKQTNKVDVERKREWELCLRKS